MLSILQRNFLPSLIKKMKKVLFVSLLFYYCSCDEDNNSPVLVLARVKDKELSIDELEKDLKPKQRNGNQIKNYINDWVNQTLLFEEAKKENLHNDLFLNEMKNKYFKRGINLILVPTRGSTGHYCCQFT